jgi:hypothetical protein
MNPNPKNDPAAAAETSSEGSRKHVPEKQLRNHRQLANVHAVQVAQIAATLRRNGEDEIEAVRVAYTLLDVAEHCKLSLKNQASVEAGLKSYQKGVKADTEFCAALEKVTHYEYKRRPNGKRLPDGTILPGKRKPIDFDEGLKIAIPLPKSTRDKPTERLIRLKRFLKELLKETHPKMDEEKRMLKAAEQIERMQRKGIEPNFFAFLKVKFPSWWEEAKARDQSVKGTHGQAVKKGKQGRVKSDSDKRKGARPPIEELRKILKPHLT